jgi:hypothetical protein
MRACDSMILAQAGVAAAVVITTTINTDMNQVERLCVTGAVKNDILLLESLRGGP